MSTERSVNPRSSPPYSGGRSRNKPQTVIEDLDLPDPVILNRICVVYLKVFEKLYAPLLNGILKPFKDDAQRHNNRTSLLDRVYRTVSSALDLLVDAVGLRAA